MWASTQMSSCPRTAVLLAPIPKYWSCCPIAIVMLAAVAMECIEIEMLAECSLLKRALSFWWRQYLRHGMQGLRTSMKRLDLSELVGGLGFRRQWAADSLGFRGILSSNVLLHACRSAAESCLPSALSAHSPSSLVSKEKATQRLPSANASNLASGFHVLFIWCCLKAPFVLPIK